MEKLLKIRIQNTAEAGTGMGGSSSKPPPAAPAPQQELTLDVGEDLESSLRKLIPLVHAGDVKAQQQAASCLANLAVQDEHQVTIVKQGGLLLLVPLMAKGDIEVQRLAAHAVANLAVNADNRQDIVDEAIRPGSS